MEQFWTTTIFLTGEEAAALTRWFSELPAHDVLEEGSISALFYRMLSSQIRLKDDVE